MKKTGFYFNAFIRVKDGSGALYGSVFKDHKSGNGQPDPVPSFSDGTGHAQITIFKLIFLVNNCLSLNPQALAKKACETWKKNIILQSNFIT